MSRNAKLFGNGVLALALGLTSATGAWAMKPAALEGQTVAVESIIASWEAADSRLTSLLVQVQPQARRGIERAIQANREGRQRALDALNSAGPDTEKGQARAQLALEEAAARAESSLNEARAHVPDHVLPRLDEAAVKMRAGIASGAAGVAKQSEHGTKPAETPRVDSDRPDVKRPIDVGFPSSMGRPSSPGVPPQRPSHSGR